MLGYNHFFEIAALVKPFCQDVVKITAMTLQEDARAGAPVDTGFLQGSIYVSDWEGSDYGGGGSPPGDSYLLPEQTAPNDTSAVVGCGANYSIYQEMGTYKMAAQPFFYEAVAMAGVVFAIEMSKFEEALAI